MNIRLNLSTINEKLFIQLKRYYIAIYFIFIKDYFFYQKDN